MNADDYAALTAYTAQFRGDTVEETEFTDAEREEIWRRYAQSKENPWTIDQLRETPDLIVEVDDDYDEWRKLRSESDERLKRLGLE